MPYLAAVTTVKKLINQVAVLKIHRNSTVKQWSNREYLLQFVTILSSVF